MMAAILNSAILVSDSAIMDSGTLLSSNRFTQKHSHSILTLTQSNSIWLKLIHSDWTWWWQPSWILPILNSAILVFTKKTALMHLSLKLMMAAILELCHHGFRHLHSFILTETWLKNSSSLHSATLHKKTWFNQSDLTWWWQPSWILPCWFQTLPSWIQTPCYLLSDSLKNTLTPFWLWLKLIQSDSNSFILPQLDNGRNLEFCQFAFSHLSFPSQTHSHLPRLVPTICKKNLTHSFWLNLMMAAILNSAMLDSDTAILDSDTLLSSLRFTQKDSPSTPTLTQTNSIWLTRWWIN